MVELLWVERGWMEEKRISDLCVLVVDLLSPKNFGSCVKKDPRLGYFLTT